MAAALDAGTGAPVDLDPLYREDRYTVDVRGTDGPDRTLDVLVDRGAQVKIVQEAVAEELGLQADPSRVVLRIRGQKLCPEDVVQDPRADRVQAEVSARGVEVMLAELSRRAPETGPLADLVRDLHRCADLRVSDDEDQSWRSTPEFGKILELVIEVASEAAAPTRGSSKQKLDEFATEVALLLVKAINDRTSVQDLLELLQDQYD